MAEILFIPSVLADYILDVKSSGMLFLHANLASKMHPKNLKS